MNRIEGKARVPLTGMAEGSSVSLTVHDQVSVARWITLKIIVAENGSNYPITPKAERQSFMTTGQIPPCFRIYAAHPETEKIGMLRQSLTVSLPGKPAPILDGVRGNMEQVAFALGYMFVVVNASFVSGLQLEDGIDFGLLYDMRLWPIQRATFHWPPVPFLNDSDIRTIAGSIEELKTSGRYTCGGGLPREYQVG